MSLNNMNSSMRLMMVLVFSFYKLGLYAQKNLDTTQILDLIKTANAICENEPNKTIEMGHQAFKASEKINFLKGKVSACNLIGVGYDISSTYDSALYFYNKGLGHFQKLKDPSLKASLYNNIGLTYWNLSDYKKAIVSYHQALSIFKQTSDIKGLAKTYNNLGLLYDDMLDSKTAINNYNDAISNYKFLKDSAGLSVAYLNLGSAYYTQNNNEKAEYYFLKSIKLKKLNDFYGKSIVLLNWAQLKNDENQSDTAIILLQQSIKFKEKVEDINGLITAYNVLANCYNSTKQYNNAIGSAKKALVLNQKIQSKRRLIKTYALLKKAYLNMNITDSALKYNDLEYALKDSIFSENLSDAIANEKIKYATLSVENENLNLKLKTEKQSFTLKTIWITLGFILISVILFLVFYFRTKKNRQIIQKQEQTNQLNQAVFDTEQIERERIARDLHDSVGQKLSVLKMQLSLKDLNTIASSKLLDEAIQDVRNVSHNLIPADLSKGLIMALENMQEQINLTLSGLQLHLNITTQAHSINLEKQHSLLIYRIIQELVNNAIKYAQAKNIHISMDLVNKELILSLNDDGLGFDLSILEQNNGIGIKNINERVKQLIGSIQLTSSLGKGTQINITIPV